MSDVIREAAGALYEAGFILRGDLDESVEIIRAKLEAAVPAKTPIDEYDEGAHCWNECRAKLGLGGNP